MVEPICVLMFHCDPRDIPGYLYGLNSNGQWIRLELQCRGTAEPTLTAADVSRAFVRIPLPELRLVSQPSERTLVNLDTIFYVEAQPMVRTVTLLGQDIRLAITPAIFRWAWGDGITTTTTTPGAPYPAREVTHRYERTGIVKPRLSITWTARWRTANGTWAQVPGEVTTTALGAPLQILEAVPHLSGPDRD